MLADTVSPELQDKKPWALKALPPFPPVALQLLSLLDIPEVPLKKIVDLLRVDPAISAELLRVANSALYGFVQSIDSVKHAIIVLGSENVKRLALTVALGKFSKGFLRGENLRACWNHVVASALIAEELAVSLNIAKDRAYTAGLLHDVGRLALMVSYPVEYGNLLSVAQEQNFDQLECERQLFDIDHCSAGRWLAEHWSLPAEFADAISEHHDRDVPQSQLSVLVRCACRLADCVGYGVLARAPAEDIPRILSELPLTNPAQIQADLESAGERIERALQTMVPGGP